MTVKRKFWHKALSVFMSIALLLSVIPMTMFASAEETSPYAATADAHTLNNWKKFFGTQAGKDHTLSTEFAGGVWTDKSVFTVPDKPLTELPAELMGAMYNGNHISMSSTPEIIF